MGFAFYRTPNEAELKDAPGWYDVKYGIRDSDIVGWAIWFNSGAHYCSLSTRAASLPVHGIVQVLVVWSFQSREPEHIVASHYTREVYPIPLSSVILKGGWTDMGNHDRITRAAAKEHWPPSWVTK